MEPSPFPKLNAITVDLSSVLTSLSDGQVTHLVKQMHYLTNLRGGIAGTLLTSPRNGFVLSPRQSVRLGRQLLLLCMETPSLAKWMQSESAGILSLDPTVELLDIGEIESLGAFCVSTAVEPVWMGQVLQAILDQAEASLPASSATLSMRDLVGSTPNMATAAPPAERWINAQIDDHVPGAPLLASVPFTLDLGVDANRSISAVASDKFAAAFPDGVDEIELTVVLVSDDFDIEVSNDSIRVPRTGSSSRNARFVLTPRQEGPSVVRAFVFVGKNFVQSLKIPLEIGEAESGSLRPETSGRWIDAAVGLGRRDITLVVQRVGDGYSCVAIGPTHASCRLSVTYAQLAAAIRTARNAIMRVITSRDGHVYPFQASVDIAPERRDAALRILAEAGYLLFQEIFFGPTADAQAKIIGRWLMQQPKDGERPLKVQIVAREFPVPWAMLYLCETWDVAAEVDWRCFLGMRHVIEQIPSQMDLSTPGERIGCPDSPLQISLSFNAAIDEQMESDYVSRQNEYWAAAATRLSRPLACTQRSGKAEFIAALKGTDCLDEIIYLFCHAETVDLANAGGPAASWLALAGDERVTLKDLRLGAPESLPLNGKPLVFINACESAELSPEFYDGFVPYFMSKGARGVIGTECKTPAGFAVDWSICFFDRFLKGKPLGEVVFELRRAFYTEHGNPLGLMYAVHCDGDTVVAQSSD